MLDFAQGFLQIEPGTQHHSRCLGSNPNAKTGGSDERAAARASEGGSVLTTRCFRAKLRYGR
jgi:hypothetical protein